MTDTLNSMFVAMAAKAVDAETRREKLDGEEHLVVPAVAMRSGVLNGVYYSSNELKKFANTWNGVPVPVGHPEEDGVHVSANSPKYEATTNIGKVYGAHYAQGRLKCELWLHVDKMKRLGFEALIDQFEDKREICEISTGLFSEIESAEGTFNNQAYEMIAHNIVPDHIALLMNDIGACSVSDGCGALRTNELKTNCGGCESEKKGFIAFLKQRFGFGINATSDNDVRYALELAVRETSPKSWVMDVFGSENYFIFEDGDKLYRKFFTEKGGEVTLSSEAAVEVARETRYVTVNQTSDPGGNPMTDKAKAVDELIANESTQFTEDDREALSAMDEAMLAKLTPNNVGKGKGKAKADADDTDEEDDSESNPKANAEGGVVTLTAEQAALFNRLADRETARQTELRENVMKHYDLAKEVVANMSIEAVEGLAGKIKVEANYAGQAGCECQSQWRRHLSTHRRSCLPQNDETKSAEAA